MLEIQRIRNEKEVVIEGLKKRHFDARPIIDELIEVDASWRSKKGEFGVYRCTNESNLEANRYVVQGRKGRRSKYS